MDCILNLEQIGDIRVGYSTLNSVCWMSLLVAVSFTRHLTVAMEMFVTDTGLLYFLFPQLNTEWAQVEVIDLINDGSGLGFGIIGGRSTGVVVKTILPGGVADRVSASYCGPQQLETFRIIKHDTSSV
jgi:hypothetical protein